VTLIVKDVERSVKFYRDDFGLRQKVRYANEWVEFEVSGTVIALHPNRKAKASPSPKTMSIRFQVKNLDGTAAKLEKRGVTFKIVDEGFPSPCGLCGSRWSPALPDGIAVIRQARILHADARA
jgi:predicted enzyme related to lactoylglutathione lyase